MTLSPSSSLSDIFQMPGVSCQDRALEPFRQRQIVLRVSERRQKRAEDNGELPKCARWMGVKAHLCCHRKLHLLSLASHAGAGNARSRAISNRISWNICRDTA